MSHSAHQESFAIRRAPLECLRQVGDCAAKVTGPTCSFREDAFGVATLIKSLDVVGLARKDFCETLDQ